MKTALPAVLPGAEPGMALAEAQKALLAPLDQALFPKAEKAGWWLSCLRRDLEFQGVIARAPKAPVRLHKRTGVGQ